MADENEELVRQILEAIKSNDSPGTPYIFDDGEVQWLLRVIEIMKHKDGDLHMRRSVKMVASLTDKQIQFLPEMLDGGLFGRRILKYGFWLLVALGTILANWQRIKDALGWN